MRKGVTNINKIAKTVIAAVLIAVLALGLVISACGAVLIYGPFQEMRDIWIDTAMTTFSKQYLAKWFFTDEYIYEVMQRNNTVEPGADVDTSLIDTSDKTDNTDASIPTITSPGDSAGNDGGQKVVSWEDCSRGGFKAYMLIVRDPSLVKLGVTKHLGSQGQSLSDLVEDSGALAGINAGGFDDPEGKGRGGVPVGVVMKDGEVVWDDHPGSRYSVIGFDDDDKLIMGKMTVKEMKKKNLRDAIEFSPFLIVNGEAAVTGSSLHPRSAIGQTKDGTVLMLTIDGRSLTSIGAYQSDIIKIMQEYGAVNCANLDGGSSSTFVYDGELVNVPSTPMGQRYLPTAFLVMPPK